LFIFNKFSIHGVLNLTLKATILSMIIFFFIVSNYSSETNNLNKIFLSTTAMKQNLYKVSRIENRFREFKEEQYIHVFNTEVRKLKHKLDDMDRRFKEKGWESRELQKFGSSLNEYTRNLLEYAKYERRLGENRTSGLLTNIQMVKNNLHRKIGEITRYDFTKDMLILEMDEREFINLRDIFFLKKFEKNYSVFQHRIVSTNGLRDRDRDELLLNLEDYRSHFSKIVETITKIGNSKDSGILRDLRNELYSLHNSMDRLIVEVDKNVAREYESLERNSIFGVAGVAILLILFASLAIKRVLFSVERIEDISKDLSASSLNLVERYDTETKDELNRVSDNINVFIESLRSEIEVEKSLFDKEDEILKSSIELAIKLKDLSSKVVESSNGGLSTIHSFNFDYERVIEILRNLEEYLLSIEDEFGDKDEVINGTHHKLDEMNEINLHISQQVDEIRKVLNSDLIESIQAFAQIIEIIPENHPISNEIQIEIGKLSDSRNAILDRVAQLNLNVIQSANGISSAKISNHKFSDKVTKFIDDMGSTISIISQFREKSAILDSEKRRVIDLLEDIREKSMDGREISHEHYASLITIADINSKMNSGFIKIVSSVDDR
jgi:hypothetical protein